MKRIAQALAWFGMAMAVTGLALAPIPTRRTATAETETCTWRCVENTECSQLDIDCHGCQGLVTGGSCAEGQAAEFNPAGIVIKKRLTGGSERAVPDGGDGQVICSRYASCSYGDGMGRHRCESNSNPCVEESIFIWMVCYPCRKVGSWTNVPTTDYRCEDCG